ncbi:MAG TPA: hypothetical protein VNQ90_10595 [Chthoniobacteraceae bacterium]|nr:hypothetical protein [Chthoniobacteraceae bacterium]
MPRVPTSRPFPPGFTLVETLLTLALTLLFLVVAVSGMGRMSEATKTATCLQNLREIGVALNLHAVENGGRYPDRYSIEHTTTWRSPLNRYLGIPEKQAFWNGKVWKCPAALGDPVSQQHYGMNQYVFVEPWNRRIMAPPAPARYVIVGEIYANNEHFIPTAAPCFEGGTKSHNRLSHRGKAANYLFADGHVETRTGNQGGNIGSSSIWKWW